jgi:hypothetical protein
MAWFNDPRDVAVPYVGLLAIVKGRKRDRQFSTVALGVGASV